MFQPPSPTTALRPWEVVLGFEDDQSWRQVRYQVQTVVHGPPRTGKTRGVFIPNVIAWLGSTISTSTRTDVFWATHARRSQLGTVWLLDPLQTISRDELPAAVRVLDWSPVRGCEQYDTAQARARALCAGVGEGITDGNHWHARGCQALALLLLAAAVDGRPMSQVVRWVQTHNLDEPAGILATHHCVAAHGALASISNANEKEMAGVLSVLGGALHPFDAAAVIESADRTGDCGFDAAEFLAAPNTLYVIAPTDGTVQLAPLVVGAVEELHQAARRISDANRGTLPLPVLYALDEVANICPLPSLLGMMGEGGGRGEIVIAGIQDRSQVARRWDRDFSDALLNTAGAKLFMPGLTDSALIRDLEYLGGLTEIEHTTRSETTHHGDRTTRSEQSSSALREVPIFSGARLRTLPLGTAFALVENQDASVVRLINFEHDEPFRAWSQSPVAESTAQLPGAADEHLPPPDGTSEFVVPGTAQGAALHPVKSSPRR